MEERRVEGGGEEGGRGGMDGNIESGGSER